MFIVKKSGDEIAVFPVSKLQTAKAILEKHEEELLLLPDGDYAVFVEGGKVEFKKLESVSDEPAVRVAMFRYIPEIEPGDGR